MLDLFPCEILLAGNAHQFSVRIFGFRDFNVQYNVNLHLKVYFKWHSLGKMTPKLALCPDKAFKFCMVLVKMRFLSWKI